MTSMQPSKLKVALPSDVAVSSSPILGVLLGNHPLCGDSISSSLSKNDIRYTLDQITYHARCRSIQQAIKKGNHKSARDQPEKAFELLTS
jgi:hypothetical protein